MGHALAAFYLPRCVRDLPRGHTTKRKPKQQLPPASGSIVLTDLLPRFGESVCCLRGQIRAEASSLDHVKRLGTGVGQVALTQ